MPSRNDGEKRVDHEPVALPEGIRADCGFLSQFSPDHWDDIAQKHPCTPPEEQPQTGIFFSGTLHLCSHHADIMKAVK